MNKAKILIADDSPTVRNILSSIFENEGFITVTVPDGIEAIRAVYREQPDIILLDIFMPHMNGYQVCRLLKNDKNVANIPVLILTSAEGKQEKFWSLQTGADEFMVKDFDTPQIIIKTVKKFLIQYRKIKQDLSLSVTPLSNPIEILSKVSALLDNQLYDSTLEKIKLETILSSLTEGLIVLDRDKRITAFNPAIEQMVGLRACDVLGKGCCEVFSDSLCKDSCYFKDAFLSGKDSIDVEFELIFKPKIKTSVLISISLLKDNEGRLTGAVCVVKDITKIKVAEAMKADFVSMATHELRTPLVIIKASANNLLEEIAGKINQRQAECLEIVRNTSQRLLMLSSDLLDLSKLESGVYKLNIEDVDMRNLILHCLKDFETLVAQKKLKVSSYMPQDLPVIQADFNKLEQVLINLISNAIKFTQERGEINVKVRETDDSIECSVSDTGRGIPADAKEKIFDKFQQIYNKESRRTGGTGLGLSVVKAIVQAHKGRIKVESELGQGSKFIFTIPKSVSK